MTSPAIVPSYSAPINRRAVLFLGCDSPTGKVSGREWYHFVRDVVSSRLPGFTVSDAIGGYRHKDGRFIQESSHELSVVFDVAEESNILKTLHTIADSYRAKFAQESVLLTVETISGGFLS
jgi:hypothetical protein